MGTERDIVQAALEVLSASSIDQLTVRDIAARAGVNVATVHYYFRTKDGIITAALREFFTPVMTTLKETLALDCSARDKLLTFLVAYLDNFHAHPGVFNSLIAALMAANMSHPTTGPNPAEGVLLEVVTAAKHHMLALIREITRLEDPEALARTTLRTMTSVLHPLILSRLPQAVLGLDFSDPEVRRRYLEGVVDSLDARPPSPAL